MYVGMNLKHMAAMKIIFGALLLLNAFVWPRWLGIDGWIAFVAVLMVIGGVIHLVVSFCPHCQSCYTPEVKAPAKKKR